VRGSIALTVQDKFARTETRGGGEVAVPFTPAVELTTTAFAAPGAEVLPRATLGAGVTTLPARGLVLAVGYRYDGYADARVHGLGPSVEWYAGRWLVTGSWRYTITRFDGIAAAPGRHAGLASLGWQYGQANIVRVFGFAGAESFGEPSRDRIGTSDMRGAGLAWRQFVSSALGLEATYAFEHLSGGAAGTRHRYGLRLVRRW
jgi:YaiO family outer membrane protein